MQQSDTEPRQAPKVQGRKTHEQQQRIINKQENTKGTDAPLTDETLKHAAMRYPQPGPGDESQLPSGPRTSSGARLGLWLTTGTRSLVTAMSVSIVVTPIASARRNAASVFSGARPRAPR